ncbi:hypothetical protein B0H11DRAFT_2417349 [Mycena galericulata]|nr:hypothetical protein B0H11DRAFT_2417349 [Mycena galericulata]
MPLPLLAVAVAASMCKGGGIFMGGFMGGFMPKSVVHPAAPENVSETAESKPIPPDLIEAQRGNPADGRVGVKTHSGIAIVGTDSKVGGPDDPSISLDSAKERKDEETTAAEYASETVPMPSIMPGSHACEGDALEDNLPSYTIRDEGDRTDGGFHSPDLVGEANAQCPPANPLVTTFDTSSNQDVAYSPGEGPSRDRPSERVAPLSGDSNSGTFPWDELFVDMATVFSGLAVAHAQRSPLVNERETRDGLFHSGEPKHYNSSSGDATELGPRDHPHRPSLLLTLKPIDSEVVEGVPIKDLRSRSSDMGRICEFAVGRCHEFLLKIPIENTKFAAHIALKVKSILPPQLLDTVPSGVTGAIIDIVGAMVAHHVIKRDGGRSWRDVSSGLALEFFVRVLVHMALNWLGLSSFWVAIIQYGSTVVWKYSLSKPVKKIANSAMDIALKLESVLPPRPAVTGAVVDVACAMIVIAIAFTFRFTFPPQAMTAATDLVIGTVRASVVHHLGKRAWRDMSWESIIEFLLQHPVLLYLGLRYLGYSRAWIIAIHFALRVVLEISQFWKAVLGFLNKVLAEIKTVAKFVWKYVVNPVKETTCFAWNRVKSWF